MELLSDKIERLAAQGHRVYPTPDLGRWDYTGALERGTYFLIPLPLWRLFVPAVGAERFNRRDISRESEIGKALAGYAPHAIAIQPERTAANGGRIVECDELLPFAPGGLSRFEADGLIRDYKKNPAEVRMIDRQLQERREETMCPARAYLGWLLTNPEFVAEHDGLCAEWWNSNMAPDAFPLPRRSSSSLPAPTSPAKGVVASCLQFYARWRLQSLTLPNVPNPEPFEAPPFPDPVKGCAPAGVARLSVPDYFPVRGRDSISQCLEAMLRGGGAEDHLQEWFNIVQPSSNRANVFPKYDRWFRLQHYWRLLHRRYSTALHRKKESLIGVFAEFLEVSTDTVKSDLREMEAKLGSGWEQRGAARP